MKKTAVGAKNQSGFTLIEISFVLVVIGLLLAAALTGAKSYIDTQKANGEAIAYHRAVSNLQMKYRGAPNTAAVTTANAVTGNIFDASFVVDKVARTVANQFGGAITVAPATISVANDAFALTTREIPDAVCQKIVPLTVEWVAKIDITGTATVNVQASQAAPAQPAAIDNACNGDAAGNSIKFTFYKNS